MLNPDPSPAVGHVRGGVDARCRVLAPAPPVDFLPRDRLSAQLTAGVGDRLTVVSGGPGWGVQDAGRRLVGGLERGGWGSSGLAEC